MQECKQEVTKVVSLINKSNASIIPVGLVKIHQYLLKLLSGNKNTSMSRAGNTVKN